MSQNLISQTSHQDTLDMFETEILELQKTHDKEIATNAPNSRITMGVTVRMMNIYSDLEASNDFNQVKLLRTISQHFDGLIGDLESITEQPSAA